MRSRGGSGTIQGGFGQDTMHGGTANDVLYCSTATTGNDFILFDPATGKLFCDADGNGPGVKLLFATLVGLNGALDFTDFTTGSSPG